MTGAADPYEQYEAALTALEAVPAIVTQGLETADRQHRAERDAADSVLSSQMARVADLRTRAVERYIATVAALNEHGEALPRSIRPDLNLPGDEQTVKSALLAQAEAVSAIDTQLRALETESRRRQEDAERRMAGAQRSVDALRVRQDKLNGERERAAADAHLREEAAARRQRRVRMAVAVIALVLLIGTITILTITNR